MFDLGDGFSCRERSEWGASFNYASRRLMVLPATEVYLHHTVTPVTGDPDADFRYVEDVTVSRFGVPSYSFLVHPAEVVGQMCDDRQGAHTAKDDDNRNDTSYGISFVGNYETRRPTDWQLRAAAQIIRAKTDGVEAGKLEPGAPILGHRDFKATACPGALLYAQLPTIRTYATEADVSLTDDDRKAIASAVWGHPMTTIQGTPSTAAGIMRWALYHAELDNVDEEALAAALAPLIDDPELTGPEVHAQAVQAVKDVLTQGIGE